MHTVFDVANYILTKCGTMTTMKLQKLVYYCQAWSLAWDDKPLFSEDFEAWANGPVCKKLYNIHRGKFEIGKDDLKRYVKDMDFTDEEKETMDIVIDDYADKAPFWLSELTHSERPWKVARGNTPLGAPCSQIITKESMQNYYNELAARQ